MCAQSRPVQITMLYPVSGFCNKWFNKTIVPQILPQKILFKKLCPKEVLCSSRCTAILSVFVKKNKNSFSRLWKTISATWVRWWDRKKSYMHSVCHEIHILNHLRCNISTSVWKTDKSEMKNHHTMNWPPAFIDNPFLSHAANVYMHVHWFFFTRQTSKFLLTYKTNTGHMHRYAWDMSVWKYA